MTADSKTVNPKSVKSNLQPFWETKKKEKENEKKEQQKRLFWDYSETPLVDRVKTPSDEELKKVFEFMSLENGKEQK